MSHLIAFVDMWVRQHFNECWFKHFALACVPAALAGLAGRIWLWVPIAVVAVLIAYETYKAVVYDPKHGVKSKREQWGDWGATAIGAVFGALIGYF